MTANEVLVDIMAPGAPQTYVYDTHVGFENFAAHYFQGGFTWVSFTCALDLHESAEEVIRMIERARSYFKDHSDRYSLVDSIDDVLAAKETNRLAVSLNLQGTNPIEGDLDKIELFRELGVGHMLLAYNEKNRVGSGCHEKVDQGLTQFGADVVAEMNRVGVAVDLSHTGEKTSLEAIAQSTKPVIISHSNARALCDHERNVSDEQIIACADSGGVIGVVGVDSFLTNDKSVTPIQALLNHIKYIADLTGVDHVGLGLDFVEDKTILANFMTQNVEIFPEGAYTDNFADKVTFFPPSRASDIKTGLKAIGFSSEDISKILGSNWMRVFAEIWSIE